MAKEKESGHAREIWAVTLVGLSLLLLLSLLSYSPKDWPNATSTGGPPINNLIGPVGAGLSWSVFLTFGFAGYALMLVLAGLGVVLLLGHDIPWRSKVGAGLLLVVSASCLLHVFGLKTAADQQGFVSAGGFVGMATGDFFHRKLVGKWGTYIVFGVLYVISLIVLINLRPSYWAALAVDTARDGWRKLRGKPSLTDELREQERELRLKEARLEREVARQLAVEDEEAKPQPVEPVIKDVSVPPKAKPEPEKPKEKEKAPGLVEKIAAAAVEKVAPKKEPVEAKPAPPPPPKPKPEKPTPPPAPAPERPPVPYQFPPLTVFQQPDPAHRIESVVEDLKLNAEILRSTLDEFGIPVQVTNVTKGPVVTLYEVVPSAGVKVEKITALSNNIALAMKAVSIRLLAPVPGKGTVGIEVPNPKSAIVYMRDILESEEWRKFKARVPVALGRDVAGNVILADLADMPHMLIAGATGSGKTVCVNAILASLLYKFSPDDLRLVLVDPKVVEMQQYNVVPHLVVPVVTEAKKAILALRWCINEMEKRFQILAKAGVRNITAFNNRPRAAATPVKPGEPKAKQEVFQIEVPRDDELVIPDKLPYIIIIVDELADLMQQAGADIENAVARLAALSRAVGIHMVLATQRPSVDVVTGVIKANFPARIAFQVASKQDSRVILDANGADKLLGKGDMLYLPPGSSKLIRAQGVLVLDDEIHRLVEFIGQQGGQQFVQEIHAKLSKKMILPSDMSEEDAEDEALVEQSIEVIRQTQRASVSVLQRRLRIGYTRAARIMDLLEERGIVGPGKGAEPRDILMDLDQRAAVADAAAEPVAPEPEDKEPAA